jgi:hypothetical protein
VSDPVAAVTLAQECRVFSRYLAGIEATPYLLEAYVRGHAHLPAGRVPPDALDQLLLGVARRSPWLTRIADAYARRARPTGILRQKLVLQLAVLESSPPAHGWINGAETGPIPLVLAKVGWAVGLAVLSLVIAAIAFGPIHAAVAIRPGMRDA